MLTQGKPCATNAAAVHAARAVALFLVAWLCIMVAAPWAWAAPTVPTTSAVKTTLACTQTTINAWPNLALEPLNATTWWVRGQDGDSDARNGGLTSHLLLVADGQRLWLLGAGPSPTFARALACTVQRDLKRSITDVVTPWAHAELALGASGWPQARHWAHADVARAMRARCARCEARMRQRLDTRASDLGAQPVRIPSHTFAGASGRLGPMRWWRLWRDPSTAVTVFDVPDAKQPLLSAHGLVWVGTTPDVRDSTVAALQAGLQSLLALPPLRDHHRQPRRLIGEQGPSDAPMDATLAAQMGYLKALAKAVAHVQALGGDGLAVPSTLPGVAQHMTQSTQHQLNWQRAWRQAEDASFAPLKR